MEPVGEVERRDRRDPQIRIAFALVKGERPEWTVQKLTELGVDRITPIATARAVVKWEGDKAERHVERLARVAREAAMQSRQRWLPVVDAITPFDSVAGEVTTALALPRGAPPSLDYPTVLIGPEGGWSGGGSGERRGARRPRFRGAAE